MSEKKNRLNSMSPRSSKLYEEALKYCEMKTEMGKNWMKDTDKVFIIDKNWVLAWKLYINYDYVKKMYKELKNLNNQDDKSKFKYEVKKEKHPGSISNTKIIYPINEFYNDGKIDSEENIVIRHDIDQNKSIKIIRSDVWKYLFDIYGGGPECTLPILEEKINNSNYTRKFVELYVNKYFVCFFPKRSLKTDTQIDKLIIKPIYITKRKHISDLKNLLIKSIDNSHNITLDKLRLWKFNSVSPLEELKKLLKSIKKDDNRTMNLDSISYLEYVDSRLDYLNWGNTDIILVEHIDNLDLDRYFEIKKIDFKEGYCPGCKDMCNDNIVKMLINPCSCKEVWYCSEQCKDSLFVTHQAVCIKNGLDEDELKRNEKSKMGLVGLQNLGNTCFMNTSLQCISSCWELTNYFLNNHYKSDINLENPIGTKGILARAYANLLKNIWYNEKTVYSPFNFKRAISTFQPMFSGYGQHDTQEFLNYLLDGLHEDLNRVVSKPLVEKEDNKKADNVKSLEQWYGFLLRNQSVLVDLLYGQFKSTLYCPNEKCQNISTTFDPFLSMSLPLTNKVEPFEVVCFFIFYDINIKPIQMHLPFSSECTMMAFRNKIAKILDVAPFSFFIVKMDGAGNYDYLVSSTSLLKVNNSFSNPNQKPFFLFQIDPELFYEETENKFFQRDMSQYKRREFYNTFQTLEARAQETKKLFKEDYEEDETNATEENSDSYYASVKVQNANRETQLGVMKINTDDNHGFSNEYIRIVVHLNYYSQDKPNPFLCRERIIFPRIIYAKTDWTLEQLHYTIFDYCLPLVSKSQEAQEGQQGQQENLEMAWDRVFSSNFDCTRDNDTYEFQEKNNYPYRLRVRNIMMDRNRPCLMCCEIDCKGCLLPFSSDLKIIDLISKYPKSDVGKSIDNTYLYLQDFQRKYHQKWNRDFTLELSWLTEYRADVHRLNEKVDHDFKIQKSDIFTGISIYDCFKIFTKLEKLEEMNEWYCSNCKTHQKATKKMEIYKSPHIIIIQLKRFKNLNKLDCLVDFPIVELDLSPYVINNEEHLPLTYDLFAVSNHIGSTGSGHYYAYAKNPNSGLWFRLDDSSVTPLSQKEIVTNSAYVLFYRRRNLENIIDLEEIYKKKFMNFETLMQSVEITLQTISQISLYGSNDI